MAKKVAFTIYIDELTGEIEEVKTTKRFSEEGALYRMDVIQDAIEALDSIYEFEKGKYFNNYNKIGMA